MIKRRYDKEQQIPYVTLLGKITPKEVGEYFRAVAKDVSLPRVLRVCNDSTDAEYCFTPKDLPEIKEEAIKQYSVFDKVIISIIQNKPVETALSTLYETVRYSSNIFSKTFSTIEAGLQWLNSMGGGIEDLR